MTFATAQQDRVNRASLRAFGGTVQLDGVDVQGDFTDAMARTPGSRPSSVAASALISETMR